MSTEADTEKTMRERVVEWLAEMVVVGIALTPLLALMKVALGIPLPWIGVLVPWLGTIDLLATWFVGQIIARFLWALCRRS